ncbi:MAG: nitrous oxide reductase accessory protein NosL [Pseudomonadales bacterium]
MKTVTGGIFWLACSFLLSSCDQPRREEAPRPLTPTRADLGYFCRMIVEDHLGPKSQVFLSGKDEPLWFTSVRDGIAFTLLPEEPRNIRSVFVTAMDNTDWSHPETELQSWISADKAWYVVGSKRRGGMGAAEAIPFKNESAAQGFAEEFGGYVAALVEIPDNYILGNSEIKANANR